MIHTSLPNLEEVKTWIEANKFELVDFSFGQGCRGCIVSVIEMMLATKYPELVPKDECWQKDRIFLPDLIGVEEHSSIVNGFDNGTYKPKPEYYDYGRQFRILLKGTN